MVSMRCSRSDFLDVKDTILHAHGLDAMLEVGLDAILVPRVSVDDVPALGHLLPPQAGAEHKTLADDDIKKSDRDTDDNQRGANGDGVVDKLALGGPHDALHPRR